MEHTLNLGAQLTAARHIRKGPPCAISVILGRLADSDATSLREALADSDIAHTTIYRVLIDNGFSLSINTVQRHRRGECACEPR